MTGTDTTQAAGVTAEVTFAVVVPGGTILGMDQTHLFYDAIGLFLLAIFCMLDAYWHGRRPA